MSIKKRFVALWLVPILLFSACGKFSIPTNANTAFKNFTLCLFQEEVVSNTINLHYSLQDPEKYGITEIPLTLGSFDVNPSSALASIENLEAALKKFSYHSLSTENQLTYDILSHYFSTQKDAISYYLYEEPLSATTGIHAQLPVLLAEYQFSKKSDVDTYLSLLETIPDYFSSLIRFEQQKSASGLFMSSVVADAVIEQCHSFISMGETHYLLSTFEERLNTLEKLSSQEKSDYIKKNRDALTKYVIPAYQTLASNIHNLKNEKNTMLGLCQFSEGKEYYAHLAARETGSQRTISELKTLISKQISTDLVDIQVLLTENPALIDETVSITETPENILKILEKKILSSFPEAASVNVNIKYVPDALQEHLSPAFYLIPAIDHFKENTIYINQIYSLDDVSLFTTLAHEGYPGHLYQTTYFANTNPDPIRSSLNFLGYVEGWATYAEMCSYYISPLSKSYAALFQKNNSLTLGLYASADIGIHYDAWTLEDTISFFQQYGISDADLIGEIYTQIISDPANYLTYYIGYLEFLELKKETMNQDGENFSQKEFHQRILEIGPAPFEIVKKYL